MEYKKLKEKDYIYLLKVLKESCGISSKAYEKAKKESIPLLKSLEESKYIDYKKHKLI